MSARTTPTVAFIVANTVWYLAATAIASLLLWPIYQSTALLVLLLVATALGTAIALLGTRFRWPAPVMVLVTVAAFLAVGVPLAVPQEALYGLLPTGEGLRQLLSGVALGWKQLLTITLPVGDYQALLVPALVLSLLLPVISLSIALRSRHGDLAAFGPLVLLVVAIAFGPESEFWPVPVALSFVVVTLLWLMWRRWHRRRAAIRLLAADAVSSTQPLSVPTDHRLVSARTVLSGALILLTAGAAGVAAVTLLPPAGERQVLRSSIEQPFDPREYSSPLAGFRRYFQPATAESVIMRIGGLPDGARVRVATLDSYDGVVYTVGSDLVDSASGSFTRVPFRFDQSAVEGEPIDLDVVIGDYSGVWLPTVGQLEEVDFTGDRATALGDAFYYNDNAGTGAVIGGLDAGDSYTLEAVIPEQPAESALATATPGSAIVPSLGALPAELEPVLSRYVSSVDGAGERLLRMLQGLREEGYISHGVGEDEAPSRSGHAADRITQLLTDQRMIGDAEQYAVTAAIMARQLGFPARVVVGFAPTVAAGQTTEIVGSDVSAWVEINTQEYGWVTVDPTPPVRDIPEEQPEDPTVVSRPQPVIPPPAEEPNERFDQVQQGASQDEPVDLEPWIVVLLAIFRVLAWLALIVGVLLSPFLVVIAAKVRRRHVREQAPTAVERVTGGWREYEDAVIDHGFEPPAAATRREVAATVGGAKSSVLAAVADRAVFAPGNTATEDADKVWRAVTELNAGLDVGLTRWQRVKARVSLRSLRGYSVSKLFKR